MSYYQSQSDSYQQSDAGVPTLLATALGAFAYIVGLLLTVITTEIGLPIGLEVSGSFEGYLIIQFWIHELSIITDGSFITDFVPLAVLMAMLLTGTGYLVARANGGQKAVISGAAISIGYFIIAALSLAFIAVRFEGLLIGQLLIGLIVTGVVYPVLFGGIGGALAKK